MFVWHLFWKTKSDLRWIFLLYFIVHERRNSRWRCCGAIVPIGPPPTAAVMWRRSCVPSTHDEAILGLNSPKYLICVFHSIQEHAVPVVHTATFVRSCFSRTYVVIAVLAVGACDACTKQSVGLTTVFERLHALCHADPRHEREKKQK